MQTNVNKLNDVEFELEIAATADDLAGDLNKALRAQRVQTKMKGFRDGNVPLSIVKKVHGKALAYGVAEQAVQKTFEEQVLKEDQYEVLGQPTITELEYEYEGDLRAVVRFGVRPEFELEDLSEKTVNRLQHEVKDEDVDEEIDQMRSGRAEVVPDEGPVQADSVVEVDMQRLDLESLSPIVGEKQEGISILMSDENVMPQIKDGLSGKKAGDEFVVEFPAPEGQTDPRKYRVSVVAVNRRELPDLDDALVKEITQERIESVDDFRAEVSRQLEDGWKRRSKEMFESDLVSAAVDAHGFPVPDSVVDMYLDAFVNELKQRGEGQLPDDFDESHYRELRRAEAHHQAKWMFIRDRIVEKEGMEIAEEERDAYFETLAGDGMDVDTLKQYYRAVPNMSDQLDQRLMSDKVFDWLSERMTVEDLDLEAFQEAARAHRHEHDHDDDHDHDHDHEGGEHAHDHDHDHDHDHAH